MHQLFNERKAAQAAACLLHKAGGSLPVLKLMKLLYLAERLSLKTYGDTITGDNFVSMPHGPVLSMTLDRMNGDPDAGEWSSWIADRADHEVALRDPSRVRSVDDDLLALSDSDVECLDAVWTEFGHWDKYKLRDYTHSAAVPEWEDPQGTSRPIPPGRIFKALGFSPDEVKALTSRLREQQYIQASFS